MRAIGLGSSSQTRGPRHDLITQHYGILKSNLVIVVDLAAASVVGRHGGSGEHGNVRAVYIRWPSAECGTPSSGRRLRAGMRS
jgi:hypothetical protein